MSALTHGLLLASTWAALLVASHLAWRLAAARSQAPARILVRHDPAR